MTQIVLRILMLAAFTQPVLAQVDVLTRRNNNSRNGSNTQETILTQSNVRRSFGKLWTLYADAKIMAQPLYVSTLQVPRDSIVGSAAKTKCASGCNAVIFATMKGTLYAYMADEKPKSHNDTLLWATYLSDGSACHCPATGPQTGSVDFDGFAVDDPWSGILSTPVIDRASNSIFVVTWTNDQQYRVYNVNLVTGKVQKGPVVVQGSSSSVNFTSTAPGWIQRRKQRAGLLLASGALYVAFGGDDDKTLAGWLFVYDASTLALKTVWTSTPRGTNGGIWMGGDAPAADSSGNVYLQVANGDFNPDRNNYGDTVIQLRLENGSLAVKGFFAPCNQGMLSRCDYDQGSSGPVLFGAYIVAGGKNGKLYLMRSDQLAGHKRGPLAPSQEPCVSGMGECDDGPGVVQKWQASMGHIHGAPVLWKGPANTMWLYLMGEGGRLRAFPQITNGAFDLSRTKEGAWMQPSLNQVPACQSPMDNHGMWMPGGMLSLSSNEDKPGSGIVWAVVPANGDSRSCRGVKGMLAAYNAENVTQELWRSQSYDLALSDTRNSYGLLARFNPPTIANGKVFVGTGGDAEPLRRYEGPRPATGGPANYFLAVFGLWP